ncbi:ribosome maturation factor RimM [Solemya pervernicosa gill symbiont]|uniref:Ribosome maturation factor RimM n=2 Tax=Gammaproteobacteria incertae sedis TaxID=118884 RepID=A0A1T2L7T7_9GAMM|nr:ribosome maturation factor RimM [Candidatus Reidiella endopervernicosa]OOZ41112.1 ribosome maturation factor RimM [Solemya pervernicosa gill symbiont]QKQ26276.1 ribosome maturation factor RimM [Candidatus Reidiella endopervernicosa]
MTRRSSEYVDVGRINGLFGVKGWVKIYSHTQPRENIVTYKPWLLRLNGELKEVKVAEGKRHGKGVVARLEGVEDRDAAQLLMGAEIAIRREQFKALQPDEYYWADLVGLKVKNSEGVDLGVVDHLLETGSNDVLVLKGDRERLVPFIQGDVIEVIDLETGEMVVDWDPEF